MVNTPFKRGLAAVGIAVALGGTAVGVVGAQQAPNVPPTPRSSTAPQTPGAADQRHEQFLGALAGKLGVSADRVRQAIADARTELGLPAQGGLLGFRGLGGPGGRRGGFGFHGSLDAASTAIGINVDQLKQEASGKSLAEVARAHNVDPNRVAAALKADAATRIDQAAAAGNVPADRVAQLKQEANTRIDQLMTQQLPAKGVGPRGGRGMPGTPGAPRPGSSSAPATSTPSGTRI